MANHLWRLQEGHEARKTGKSSKMHFIPYSFLLIWGSVMALATAYNPTIFWRMKRNFTIGLLLLESTKASSGAMTPLLDLGVGYRSTPLLVPHYYHIDPSHHAPSPRFIRHDPSLAKRFGDFSWLRYCFRVSKSWLTLNRTTTSLPTLRTVKGFSFSSSITETFRSCEKSHSCCPRVSR